MTYDEMIKRLQDGERFSFSRFGDGEFNAIFQDSRSRVNCDGHAYYPTMGKRLREILESTPDYEIGLQNLAAKQRPTQIEEMTIGYNLKWSNANLIHRANITKTIGRLFDVLKDKNVLLVGPEHLLPLAKREGWYMNLIPLKNCWTEYEKIHKNIKALILVREWVVLFCASMMANVLIDDFHNDATCIDIGSAFDPHVDVISRGYHKNLKL